MDYTEIKGYEGIMSAIDLKKAFDPLSWTFFLNILNYLGQFSIAS